MSKGKVKTKLKDPLQGTAISRKFHHQIPNSFATRSKNPKAKPNWGKKKKRSKSRAVVNKNPTTKHVVHEQDG